MPIQKIVRAGEPTYKVQILRKGFPSTFATFARYLDAKAFEEKTLREQAAQAAYGCNIHLTLGEAIDAYLASEEYAKLRSDRKRSTRAGGSRRVQPANSYDEGLLIFTKSLRAP